ncbi:protein dj-1beta-like [Neocloeon triangulifer]|uniref:protein dj-1beta-like n=1 Tax=Neocloeon triangulifer TaxID=2078957 RepID=UPI00286FAC9A|nr:protein dj-1beta-like [Neocloeon triangulifer]
MALTKTLLLLAQGGEDMEIFQTIDTLRKTKLFDVTVAGVTGPEVIKTAADVNCIPDESLDTALEKGPYDLIVLPGGLYGAPVLAASEKVGRLAREQEQAGRMIASICGGGWALMKHGVGKGKRITSFPYFRALMRQFDVKKEWDIIDDERVVRAENLISSQGPGTAAEFSFAIVQHFHGRGEAELIARFFLYNFDSVFPPNILPSD